MPARRTPVPPMHSPPSIVEAARRSRRLPFCFRRARSGGYVRHCHGDLHLRNIVEIEGAPVLFDAIEFDDAIATIDVLYDLAFLLMDLGARGLACSRQCRAQRLSRSERRYRQSHRPRRHAVVPFHAGDDQGQGRAVAREASILSRERRPRRRATSYVLLARDYLERQRAAAHRHRRIVGKRQVERGAGACAASRRLSGCGACAERCRAQAVVRRRAGRAACPGLPMPRKSPTSSTPCAASVP